MACSIENPAEFKVQVTNLIEESKQLVATYKELEATHYPSPETLDKPARLERLTLRRNLFMREAWINWAEEVLADLDQIA